MPRLFHTLCVSFCIALVAGLSLHGVQDRQHQLDHAAEMSEPGSDHRISPQDHAHLDVEVEVDSAGEDWDVSEGPGGGLPTGHHHHSGGDAYSALPEMRSALHILIASDAGHPGQSFDDPPTDHDGEGPEHPPKRIRTVI